MSMDAQIHFERMDNPWSTWCQFELSGKDLRYKRKDVDKSYRLSPGRFARLREVMRTFPECPYVEIGDPDETDGTIINISTNQDGKEFHAVICEDALPKEYKSKVATAATQFVLELYEAIRTTVAEDHNIPEILKPIIRPIDIITQRYIMGRE